ncbi:hypothetical protein H4O20_10330 [Aequorivita sp. 609]|uniref:hypothetical protein n=1 Tax=Aequorivita TaxID=153265 RepID=UPI00161A3424|nr:MULTISPECIES: hypothetical protein [Aequorivita]MBB6681838.1 hypothetical protein [Aequorivita sp. 609]
MKSLLIIGISLLINFTNLAQNAEVANENDKNEEIFSSKDKDYLQYWHYEQILQMDLTEDERDGYLSLLNYYTYKMSSLGSSKYNYTDSERKIKFDELVVKLNKEMKELLNPHDYKIHEDSFKKIIQLVYNKREWNN